MSPYFILGIIACISPIFVITGMILDDLTFWLIFDIYTIIFFPIIGFVLITKIKNKI